MDGVPGFWGLPFFQIQGLWPWAQEAVLLPVDLLVALALPVPTAASGCCWKRALSKL